MDNFSSKYKSWNEIIWSYIHLTRLMKTRECFKWISNHHSDDYEQSFTSFLTLFVSWIIRELINLRNWDKLLQKLNTKLSGYNLTVSHSGQKWDPLHYGVIWILSMKNNDESKFPGQTRLNEVTWGQISYLITLAFLFQRIIVWQVCEFFCWRITKLIFVLSYQLNFTFDRWWNILICIWRHNAYEMILNISI